MAKPLALMQAAYGQAQGWRRGEDLIDALPYIDGLTPEFKQQVDALIDDEMKKSIKRPSDYLRELPPVPAPSFAGSSVLCNEYERVKSGQPMAAIDTSRFRLDPPAASKRNDLAAWKAALDNAHSQLEHQYTRILNLELVLKYGDKTWRAQNQLNEATLKQVEVEAAALAKAKNDLNQARKLAQTLAGQELSRAHTEYYSLVRKNFEIERACQVLEEQVEQLHSALQLQQPAPAPAPPNSTSTTSTASTNTVAGPQPTPDAAPGATPQALSNGNGHLPQPGGAQAPGTSSSSPEASRSAQDEDMGAEVAADASKTQPSPSPVTAQGAAGSLGTAQAAEGPPAPPAPEPVTAADSTPAKDATVSAPPSSAAAVAAAADGLGTESSRQEGAGGDESMGEGEGPAADAEQHPGGGTRVGAGEGVAAAAGSAGEEGGSVAGEAAGEAGEGPGPGKCPGEVGAAGMDTDAPGGV